MTDKMREEFEKSPRFRGMDFTRSATHPEYYESPYANGGWDGWKASREALVIELPPVPEMPEEPEDAIDDSHMDAYHSSVGMRHACSKFIEAVGLKVKP
ncbi:hypothetical protein HU742_014235 [Pseudomonas sp. SWRI102]|uniref:Uncharacterized protein n=1 Tax=Pseudomonas marvdashtae TaxID=2745500 RepID=A0A923JNX8_9PSED|nr:hypothetical protein [Pseudomonas marvdashtae]MBV4552300.1 hypothetical protein [Pseudomonas marvdashtae]